MVPNPEHYFGGTSQLLGLLDSLYRTLEEPEAWQDALFRINSTMGSECVGFFAAFPGATTPVVLAVDGKTAEVWNSYASYYAGINP